MPQKDIPTRDQIDPKDTWNLEDIYKDNDAWEADYTEGQKIVAEAGRFKGCLAGAPSLTYECLSARSELQKIVSRLYQYAYLNKDLDNRVSTYQAMTERAAMLSSMAGAAFSFVEPELLAIDEKELEEMSSQFANTKEYDFYIKELIRSKAHIRSAEVEEVLALAGNVTRGPDTIFSMLDDADLEYPVIKDEDSNDVQLTKQRFYKFLESSNRRVREDSNDAFYSVYNKHLNTLSASLASSVNGDVFQMKTRNYDSCLHASLDANNIPVSVYDSLIDTTEASLDGLHAWTRLRKRILKLDQIKPFDMMCPLFPDQDYEVPWSDAIPQVIEAAAPLGEKYCEELKTAFGNRWVDVYESQGKGSGAYNFATYTVHPYVLMNYNGTVDNMFTLAHEMGHAMHSHLANSTQCFPKARYALFVAEVASTLNEGLLLDYLLKKVTDTPQRLYLLNRAVDNAVGTFFHQVLYGHFELNIHQEVEKGNALSPAAMNQRWKQLTEKFFGSEMKVDEYTPIKWSRIPHFYNAFYVYQYATSFAASQMILSKFLAGEEGIVERYLKMLSAGGSDHPIELLKICGVDMTTPDPVQATLRIFADQVAEIDRLTQE